MLPTMIEVDSRAFAAHGYDAAMQTLYIRFLPRKDGTSSTYIYAGVLQADYEAMINAPSLGSHFIANIKNLHPFTKLD